jgi:hypothetical protein
MRSTSFAVALVAWSGYALAQVYSIKRWKRASTVCIFRPYLKIMYPIQTSASDPCFA